MELASQPTRSRTIPLELGLVVALLVLDGYHLVPLSNTPFLLALGWISLRLRGLRWRDIGFTRPERFGRALAIGTLVGLAMEVFALLVTEPLLARVVGHDPDVSDLRPLVGKLGLLGIFLLLNWTLAAFGEELAHRGYVMNRLADLGHGSGAAWVIALVASSVLFGWGHRESQGLAGFIQEGWNGLLLGLLYLGTRRNLAVPIVAHGVSNTLALVLIYFGRYPGV
jgi:CAAX protease family protein